MQVLKFSRPLTINLTISHNLISVLVGLGLGGAVKGEISTDTACSCVFETVQLHNEKKNTNFVIKIIDHRGLTYKKMFLKCLKLRFFPCSPDIFILCLKSMVTDQEISFQQFRGECFKSSMYIF